MARVTQEHVDARRRQILEAAARQFGLKGMEPGAATIDDIANDAGLSKGSIYSYFRDKEELMAAIGDVGTEMDREMFSSIIAGAPTSWDAFWQVTRQVWDHMLDPEMRAINMLPFERLLIGLRTETGNDASEEVLGSLTELLKGAQDEGKIAPDLDPYVLAAALWNCQQGIRAHILRTGDAELANAVLDLFKDLLLRTAGTSPSREASTSEGQ